MSVNVSVIQYGEPPDLTYRPTYLPTHLDRHTRLTRQRATNTKANLPIISRHVVSVVCCLLEEKPQKRRISIGELTRSGSVDWLSSTAPTYAMGKTEEKVTNDVKWCWQNDNHLIAGGRWRALRWFDDSKSLECAKQNKRWKRRSRFIMSQGDETRSTLLKVCECSRQKASKWAIIRNNNLFELINSLCSWIKRWRRSTTTPARATERWHLDEAE